MKIYLYDRKEAIKNGCYKYVHPYKNFISISLLCINCALILALVFLTMIVGLLTRISALVYFGFIILPIAFLFAVILMPIIYANENNNLKIWLYRAIVKDENSNIYLVEQKDKLATRTFINEKDIFKKIFNKEREGIITKLNNIKLVKETKKYYICSYNDQNDNNKIIKIAKAYKDIKEVL